MIQTPEQKWSIISLDTRWSACWNGKMYICDRSTHEGFLLFSETEEEGFKKRETFEGYNKRVPKEEIEFVYGLSIVAVFQGVRYAMWSADDDNGVKTAKLLSSGKINEDSEVFDRDAFLTSISIGNPELYIFAVEDANLKQALLKKRP